MRSGLLLAFSVLAIACSEPVAELRVYDTALVEPGTIEVSVSSSGVVETLATVEVKSKASGEVLGLFVETGEFVEQDTLMVSIDPRTARNQLARSEAELKAANSRRKIAQTQMERARSLVANGTLTQTDLEQAELDLATAESLVVSARVAVENARIAVDDTEIRAPVSGTIIVRTVEVGQVISSPTQNVAGGTVLMQMADLAAVQIRMLVDETDIGKIRAGLPASVSVAAYPNQPFPGEVVKIEPQAVIEQNVTMFAVLVSIRNPDGLLLPGMNAEVDIMIARREDVSAVPVVALRTHRDIRSTAGILGIPEKELRDRLARSDRADEEGRPQRRSEDRRFGGNFWVVVDNGGEHEVRRIRSGITDLDLVEVVDGLELGETVLILPSSHLVETQQDLQRFINRRVAGVPGIGR